MHCIVEPITLVCGCTFCKACLIEYNSLSTTTSGLQQELNLEEHPLENATRKIKRKLKSQSTCSTPTCFNCSKSHEQNTSDYLKQNVLITKLVEKFWKQNVEIRKLRNDARNYVAYCIEENYDSLDFNKFEYIFNSAYTLGKC